MGVQPLPLCELDHPVGDLFQRLGAVVEEAAALDEVVHPQRAGEPGGAAGGQGVVRPGEIVPQRLRHMPAEEDAAGIPDAGQQREGIRDRELQMLGRDEVCDLDRLLEAVGQDDLAVVVNARRRNLPAGQRRELPLELLGDRLRQRPRCR